MTIENVLLRTYSNFDHAQQAREKLIQAGFSPDSISLSVGEDEAGPVTGSFVIDKTQHADTDRPKPNFMEGYDPNETQSATPVDWGSSYLLTVDASDEQRFMQATEIADRFGGVDINQMTDKSDY